MGIICSGVLSSKSSKINSFGWESNTYELFVSEGMRVSGCPGPCLLNERGLGGRSYRWIEVILSCKSNQLLFHRQKNLRLPGINFTRFDFKLLEVWKNTHSFEKSKSNTILGFCGFST